MAQEKKGWIVVLEDGREITVPQDIGTEQGAQDYAERWAPLNPASDGDILPYTVTLDDGQEITVPATSPAGAQAFVEQVYTPFGRAMMDAREQQRISNIGLGQNETGYNASDNARNAFTMGLDKQLEGAVAGGATGLQNLLAGIGIGEGAGYGMQEARDAAILTENEAQRAWREENPAQNISTGLLGALGNPASRFGGNAIVGRGGAGLLSRNIVPATGRGLGVGGVYGVVEGGLNADPGEEIEGAGRGGLTGAIVGGAAPAVVGGATKATQGLGSFGAGVANRLSGGRLMAGSVDRRAVRTLADTMRADGVSEDVIRQNMNDAMRYGVSPNLLDTLPPTATRTRALIIGATQRPGRGQAAGREYYNEVSGSIQDDAVNAAYRLTPGETRTAQQFQRELADDARRLAETDYAGPYGEPVQITDETRRALQGMTPELRAAEREASFRFPERAEEIRALADEEEVLDSVSAAALDRIRRQMVQSGRNAGLPGESQNLGIAADYGARAGAIDETLDAVPGLVPARAVNRAYHLTSEGADLGLGAFSARPANYADELALLQAASEEAAQRAGRVVPTAQQGAQVGVRDAIVQRLGAAPEAATGPMNRLAGQAQANNARQVLQGTYGEEAAENFQGAMRLLRDRMATANFMNIERGSPTAGRSVMAEFANGNPISLPNIIARSLAAIRRGSTLSDADLEALVRLSTQARTEPIVPLPPRGVPVTGRAVVPLVTVGTQE